MKLSLSIPNKFTIGLVTTNGVKRFFYDNCGFYGKMVGVNLIRGKFGLCLYISSNKPKKKGG